MNELQAAPQADQPAHGPTARGTGPRDDFGQRYLDDRVDLDHLTTTADTLKPATDRYGRDGQLMTEGVTPPSGGGGGGGGTAPAAEGVQPIHEVTVVGYPEANPLGGPDSWQRLIEQDDWTTRFGLAPSDAESASRPIEVAIKPEELTSADVLRIGSTATDPDDLKLKLGLGPVSDQALGAYLISVFPELEPQTGRPWDPGPYDRSEIRPSTKDEVIVDRWITRPAPDGFGTVRALEHGTVDDLRQRQSEANREIGRHMVNNFLRIANGRAKAARDLDVTNSRVAPDPAGWQRPPAAPRDPHH
ncbi:hypothetical protein [Microlunatus sp. GCM10028923]|uniref:hypothetical protein n=1 Tax=Microlunatus sp. GCM10028923 TaxID=3273400 RepID=UPI00360739ED